MKLSEIKPLNENTGMYVVYKVSADSTDSVYYGYTIGEDVKKAFMVGANRQAEPDRGDVRMINQAGGEDNLRFQMVDVFDNEIEAFVARNDARASDGASITGPSHFPASVYQRALKDYPEKAKMWKLDAGQTTAREAMANGMFTFDTLKALVAQNPSIKNQLKIDLDKMLYTDFKTKYGV
jgi:hypothetical protein